MSSRHDPQKVLVHLGKTLDVERTLAAFPGLTREHLTEMIRCAASDGKRPGLRGVLSVDGAARGNPGHAGAGVVLQEEGGATHHFGEYLGEATNNVAEYRALILGLQKAAEMGFGELRIRSDSELVIKQLNGFYKVKNPQLQDLYFTALKLTSSFEKVTFTHVPREQNKEADRMANMAIDAKGSVSM